MAGVPGGIPLAISQLPAFNTTLGSTIIPVTQNGTTGSITLNILLGGPYPATTSITGTESITLLQSSVLKSASPSTLISQATASSAIVGTEVIANVGAAYQKTTLAQLITQATAASSVNPTDLIAISQAGVYRSASVAQLIAGDELTIFNANGAFTPQVTGNYLVIAMGGGGGGAAGKNVNNTTSASFGGLGGSGGVLSYSIISLVAGTPYAVVIGTGGTGGAVGGAPTAGSSGNPTTFNGVTVALGGAGGNVVPIAVSFTIDSGAGGGGNGGGNGGGAGGVGPTTTAAGNPGTSGATNTGGGGGGGSGALDTGTTPNNGGAGGSGGSGYLIVRRA